jgi:hypothetical protein
MTWGIVINNNYMNRPMCPTFPMFGTYNRMFDMMMKFSMFQFFMNNLMKPQTYQQPRYVQPIILPPRQPQACYNMQNLGTCQSFYPNVSFNNNVCPEFDLFEGSKLFSNPDLLKSDISLTSTENPFSDAKNYRPTKVNKKGMFLKGKGKGTEYGPQFLARVKEIANNIKCDYKDLLAIMNSESGVDAKTVGYNGASGLICFMPQYFDVNRIRKMSPMEQLDLVEETIRKSKKAAGFADNAKLSKGDLYALVFLPARAGKDVLCRKGETGKNGRLLRYYEANAALDYNRDGVITKDEMASRIDRKYVSDYTFLA